MVIMDVIDYKEKSERQLNNKEHYCQLSKIKLQKTIKQTTTLEKSFKRKILLPKI